MYSDLSYMYSDISYMYMYLIRIITYAIFIPPVYEVYTGYIVFAFYIRMFVCLSVCKLFFRQIFLGNYLTSDFEVWYKHQV